MYNNPNTEKNTGGFLPCYEQGSYIIRQKYYFDCTVLNVLYGETLGHNQIWQQPRWQPELNWWFISMELDSIPVSGYTFSFIRTISLFMLFLRSQRLFLSVEILPNFKAYIQLSHLFDTFSIFLSGVLAENWMVPCLLRFLTERNWQNRFRN